MEYTKEKQEEFARVLNVAGKYFKESKVMELFYSRKVGYFFIDINAEQNKITALPVILKEPSEIMELMYCTIPIDVLVESGKHHDPKDADEEELAETQKRIKAYSSQLPEYDYLIEKVFKAL